jgi:molecular chaperone GrpE
MEEDIKTEDVGSEQPSEAPQNKGAAVEIDWHDSFIRLYADFENFRKKKALEIDNIRRTAKKDLMIDLLPVVDAIMLAEKNEADIPEGVNNILKMFNNILAKNGLAKYGNAGDKFNDAIYDAVNVSIDDNAPKGTIIDIVKYGYTLNDDIIRHAQVVVSN